MKEILVRIVCEQDYVADESVLIQNVAKEVAKVLSPKNRHVITVNVRKCEDDVIMKQVYSKDTIL